MARAEPERLSSSKGLVSSLDYLDPCLSLPDAMNATLQPKPGHPDPWRASALRALVIFVGLPASGKSTFFQTHFAGTHRHVSKG